MKVTRYVFAAALTVIAAASCQKENYVGIGQNEIVFSASIQNPEPASKTILGTPYTGTDGKNHYPMLWYGAEKITIFDADGKNRYFVGYAQKKDENGKNIAVGMASVNFKFDDRYEEGTTFELVDGTTYYAVEPYSSAHTINDSKITIASIANNQYINIEQGNMPCISTSTNSETGVILYGEPATVAFAKTTDTYLSFSPATALIKFTIGSENVTRVIFKGQSSELLAGDSATFDFSNETPSFESFKTGKTTMYLKKADNTALTVGETYYIAVLPVTLKPQIGFNFNGSTSGAKYKKGTNEVTLTPGMILDLGTITIAQQ